MAVIDVHLADIQRLRAENDALSVQLREAMAHVGAS